MFLSRWLPAAMIAAALATAAPGADEAGFVRLFNGRDMQGFKLVGAPASTYQVRDGVIIVSGKPNGYFATEKSYRDYVLRFDWRYARPEGLQNDADFRGNSGLLIHITGEHKVWPRCIEAQLMNRDAGRIFPVAGTGAKADAKKYDAVQARAIKPVGQWNSMEIVSKDGTLTSKINGEVVSEATGVDPKEGTIGWQSEGAEIHFRNLMIREMK